MGVVKWEFTVEMVDGSEHEVIADQRDLARWEMEPFGCSFVESQSRPVAFTRYLAYRAMRRARLFAADWEQFQDACVEVRGGDAEAGDQVNPGQATPPDAP